MNEQIIRKLLAEALDNDTIIASRTFGHWPLYDEDLEKFAELIVRECADIAADQSAIRPEYRIRKHFGVEE